MVKTYKFFLYHMYFVSTLTVTTVEFHQYLWINEVIVNYLTMVQPRHFNTVQGVTDRQTNMSL